MNGNDISRLSYKELQALALRYRVPGNIKKKLLVKVLQAARGGNDNEVGRLLQDLKQNRKRRTRRMKPGKLGLTSTPLHSPNSDMADDYYCPPQQPHAQWIGAEEEIASREEDNRIPNYEEFKQFLLRRMQRECHAYDVNSNLVQESGIVDLRTATASSTVQSVPMDADNYQRSNVIAVNSTESFVYQPVDQVEYQTLEDTNGNRQGPKLLKKLLQAPVGANLGEIVSPVFNGYRLWSMEQCQPGSVELDNSDTLTAESENNEEEGNLEVNQEYYGFLTGIRGEYFLNEPTFVRNVDEIGQQISTVLTNEGGQYRYHPGNLDQRHYENWTVTSVVDCNESQYVASEEQSSKILQTIYCENGSSENLCKTQTDAVHCQYRVIDTVHPYTSNQSLVNVNSAEEPQYYTTSVISSVPSDAASNSDVQNMVKYSAEKYNGEQTGEYFHTGQHYSNASGDQEAFASTISQTFSGSNHYNPGLSCEYSYPGQETQSVIQDSVEQQDNSSGNRVDAQKNASERRQASPDTLAPFWPKRCSKNAQNPVLENVLNLHSAKRIDLTRLNQTSCVYCYVAPIVNHAPVTGSSACTQKERFIAEFRQHCFSPYWMLYNDASSGMRMANLQPGIAESTGEEEEAQIPTPVSSGDPEIRDSTEKIEDSMNWTSEYMNYDAVAVKDPNLCDQMDVEDADCLFPVIAGDSLDVQVENLSGNGDK